MSEGELEHFVDKEIVGGVTYQTLERKSRDPIQVRIPSKTEEFSCKDIGISCDIYTQAESYIIPWCCMKYANIIGNYQ